MDIEFAGTHDDFTTLRADLVTLGYTIGELVGLYRCDCWDLTRQGRHFHAQIAVTAPKKPAPDPEPDTLLDDIAERLAQAAGVRVDVHHAGQHAVGEPVGAWRPWQWLGSPPGSPQARVNEIARLEALTMPQPRPRPEPEPPSDLTLADPDGRRDLALKALGHGPNGEYVVIQTRDQRRITLTQVEFDALAAGMPMAVLCHMSKDELVAALWDAGL